MATPVNLFCFPFAGGNCYSYRKFAPFSSHLRLIPLELPGRGSRFSDALLSDIHSLVDDLFLQTKDLVSSSPYAFYGHSMGTLLAYMLTSQLIKRNYRPPMHLFMSGRGGPSSCNRDPIMHDLPRAEFFDKLKTLGGLPDEILKNEELTACIEPILRSDLKALQEYQYQPPLRPFSVPITVMFGHEENVAKEDIDSWQCETTAAISVKYFSGDHFFIFKHAREIMQVISQNLIKEACSV